mgnify:CR=1 FL=1
MIMMRRCIIVLLTVIVAGYMCADSNDGYYPSTLEGLCGEDLLKAVRVVIRNHDSVMRQYDEDVLWNIFSVTDKRDDGTVWDIFSNSMVGFVADDCVPSGMVCCHIVPHNGLVMLIHTQMIYRWTYITYFLLMLKSLRLNLI